MPHRGKAKIFEHLEVNVPTYFPGLGQWLAHSPMTASTWVRDPVWWHMSMAVACSAMI